MASSTSVFANGRRRNGAWLIAALFMLLAVPFQANADDFTAISKGDFGNITVMEVNGNFDALNPDNSVNAVPRQVIAKEFFKTHKDEYDFLVIFSNFDVKMPEAEVEGYYTHIKNDIKGIGRDLFDYTALYGSDGKLQGTIDMGDIAGKVTDPLDPRFEETLAVLSHEMLHRWSAYVSFKDQEGNISKALLGRDNAHWSFLLDSKASLQYGNQWLDNKNGTFTSIAERKYYSPLDLYLMGMIDKSKVPAMLLIENSDIDPVKLPEIGATVSGTPHMVTIDDIISAEGERIPSSADSKKSFKMAFIFVTRPGTFTGKELTDIENVRNGFVTRYSILTDGKGLVQVASTLKDNLPEIPVIPPPVVDPRTLPPDINEGITWLVNRQQSDGSWSDITLTTERDTSEAVFTLQYFPSASSHFQTGLQWLGSALSNNTDYLARRIDSIINAGGDASTLVASLVALQNPDGGWGSSRNFVSSASDTALALQALERAGYSNREVIGRGVIFLKSRRNPDGGWGNSPGISAVQPTAAAVLLFSSLKNEFVLEDELQGAVTWLKQKQNLDGGFGASPSTVYETALAIMAIREAGAEAELTNKGVTYLLSQQSANGSWFDSPFQTALAVRSIWHATITPDLSIKNSDITFIPEKVSELPTTAVIKAVISNLGRTEVPQAKVVLYDGAVTPDRKVGEQTLAFPALSSVMVTFSVPIPDGKSHTFYLVVDPDKLVKESDETNNTAVKALLPELTYDLAVAQGDITLSGNPVDIYKDIKIAARVINKGTSNAYNAQIRFFIDESGAPYEIATLTTDIPAGGEVTKEVIWKAAKAGIDMPLTVQVDPANSFSELSESNNSASVPLTVTGATLPNLATSHKDIVVTPNPAMERGTMRVSTLVMNNGFSQAENVKVDFYKGVPGSDGVLIGSETLPVLAAGQSQQVAIDWGPIADSGNKIIFISVDPDNTVGEIAEDDNGAFTEVKILSLPDLAISTNSIALNPSAPKEGDALAITVTVQNSGGQDAINVPVLVKEGANQISVQVIPLIAGHGQANISIPFETSGRSGTHEIQVAVDAENVISELSDDNNIATKTFSIQNANLWVSEQYISPNGDGVKDATDFFFRLAAPMNVQVLVVNREGETVRTFAGAELDNTDGTTITWDGRGENGTLVGDGEYLLNVVGAGKELLGSLQVVVDTNRSPLTEALGTKYLLNNNITCSLPFSLGKWGWRTHDSGIWFNLDYNNANYLAGLYVMSPDGDDLNKITPNNWSDSSFDYNVSRENTVSSDRSKIAFPVWKQDRSNGKWFIDIWEKQLNGEGLKILAGGMVDANIYNLKWSPDGKKVAFVYTPVYLGGYQVHGLRMADSESNAITVVDDGYPYLYTDNFHWSPDSNYLAYLKNIHCNVDKSDCNQNYESLMVFDVIDSRKLIKDSTNNFYSFSYMQWLADGMLIAVESPRYEYEQLRLFNTNTATTPINLQSGTEYLTYGPIYSVSSDLKSVAVTSKNRVGDDYILSIKLWDQSGSITPVGSMGTRFLAERNTEFARPLWSPDGNLLAYLESEIKQEEKRVYENLVIYERSSSSTRKYVLAYSDVLSFDKYSSNRPIRKINRLVAWLADKETILVDSIEGIFAVNTESGVQSEKLPVPLGGDPRVSLSPNERYITYYKKIDTSSDCAKQSGEEIWSITSLLNLTTELRITKTKSSITLKGIAADRNFAGYKLEYADINSPDSWELISPPSDQPVVNDTFTTWVPPSEGNFYIKLTVWDKAGNSNAISKRFSWGGTSSITGLYKSIDTFSPNGDGVKDTVELNYQVMEPIHLEFFVLDELGRVVRVFLRDYAQPAVDSISWDGKDEAGKVVPDGKYSIKVLDYEFFVEVDSAFPDAGIGVSSIISDLEHPPSVRFVVNLEGRAIDEKLKKWTISSGEGDNPQEWTEYLSRSTQLFTKDDSGNITNTILGSYGIMLTQGSKEYEISSNSLDWLVGQTFRIDAEDFAGNRKTILSNRLDETIALLLWDGYPLLDFSSKTEYIPASKIRPGIHRLKGFETVRNAFTNLNLQYAVYDVSTRKEAWFDDATAGSSENGIFTLDWDRSRINSDISAVRLKGTDLGGNVFYSKRYPAEEVFRVVCNGSAENTLFGKLSTLEFQVQSVDDGRYANWTRVLYLDSSKGDPIPEGRFEIPFKSGQILDGKKYQIRMIGFEASGLRHENDGVMPCEAPIRNSMKLLVEYPVGECGAVQTKAELSLRIEEFSGLMQSVEYYLRKPEELQLLRRTDLTREGLGNVPIETTALAEGNYPVKAVLKYIDLTDNSEKTEEVLNTLIVDRVPPEARISYPSGSELVLCPGQTNEPEGPWFWIQPEGVAQDNIGVREYELSFGAGENPSTWLTAYTRGRDENDQLTSIPIFGKASLKGTIGKWNITEMRGEDAYVFKLKVTDKAGNVTCGTSSSFSFDKAVEIPVLTLDKALFSPVAETMSRLVNAMYTINESAVVDVKMHQLTEFNKNLILDESTVKTLVSGKQHLSGTEYVSWEGNNDTSATVADGRYGLAVFAKDSCGNVSRKWAPVEVDSTPPITVIDYPKPSDPLPPGNIIEVTGTATDAHFSSYALEAGEGSNPDTWLPIFIGKCPVVGGKILGQWNTFGQTGVWTLRLSAPDAAGNKNSVTSTIDLGERKTLIKEFKALPLITSPNNDGKLDTIALSYEVTDACDLKMELLDGSETVVRNYQTTTQAAGSGNYVWDGKNSAAAFVNDGDYRVRLASVLTSNPSVNQIETITITTDATPPTVELKEPAENACLNKNEVTVFGTVKDPHLVSYILKVTGPEGSFVLDQGTQNRELYAFGPVSELKEERYTITVDTKDEGENVSRLTRAFIIDRTKPKVTLDSPTSGQYFGNTGNVIDITGAIVEKNLSRYSLRYGAGEAPLEWKEIVGGDTLPASASLSSWKVGKDDGVPDGEYMLSLHAKDKAELEGEARVKIVVDNTLPVAAITSPADGVYVKGAFDVKGTISDANLDKGTLEISDGTCAEAGKWIVVKTVTSSVTDGIINSFSELPADGAYCLKVTARDKVGYSAESKANIVIDITPPSAPGLTGKINESRTGASLSWTKNNEPDFAGYNFYRNNAKLNQELLTGETDMDEGLKEGEYSYSIKAVDMAGNESEASNTVKLIVDLSGPNVRIASPSAGALVGNLVDIKGTAFSANDFKGYRVSIGIGATPSTWSVIRTSPVPTSYGSLAVWDTIGLSEGGTCTIKLEGEDLSGNVSTYQVSVTIDNTAPANPVLLAATPSSANVAVTWRANGETDLAGYLLYRNDQLANAAGVVAGSLKPYLINSTAYTSISLPDGKHAYNLVAMDQAGNMSDQSNTLTVELDNRRPHTVITQPTNGSRLEEKTLVTAESPDTDIDSVLFQYRKVGDTVWTALGPPVTGTSFATGFDPGTLGLAHGDYQLMATASDKTGSDPSPTPITVTYTDLTAPTVPAGLKAQTAGQTVNLTWDANIETDIDGYNVYRSVGSDRAKVNTSLLKNLSYLDENLANNDYSYEITAIDTNQNESKPSGAVTARVYAPVIFQPYTPIGQPALRIEGNKAAENSSVEILLDNAAGHSSAGRITADPSGVFALETISLSLGENRISAAATDAGGNVSRQSDAVVVVLNETPSAPVNLAAQVEDHMVDLVWDATNSDPEVIGYNVFRDGAKLNLPSFVSGGVVSASSYFYAGYEPSMAMDGDLNTDWRSASQSSEDYWWEVDLTQPELINHLEINWGTKLAETGQYVPIGGKDIEVQAWSGYAWIPLKKISGNESKENSFDFSPSYRTDRIRIYVTAAMSDQIWISEVSIRKDNLVASNTYQDSDAKDKNYGYKVTAVDKYGFESPPSEEKTVIVGDIIPPADPRNLSATVTGSDVTLDWSVTPNTESDLAGYLVYRNDGQGWNRITPAPVSGTLYLDAQRPNGSYTYRITATDNIGNESGPSNEANATVSVGLQVAPVITEALPLSRGDISIAWTCTASSVAGYNIYRSTTSGGPYGKINSELLENYLYTDASVVSGTTYYYVVRVEDSIGNESPNSNEASVASLDDVPPNKPIIVSPTLPGTPVTLRRAIVDVSGTADENTTVELYNNGKSVANVTAAETRAVKDMQLPLFNNNASTSPDGTNLVYGSYFYDNIKGNIFSIRSLSFATGESAEVLPKGYYPQWLADGKRFGYVSVVDNNKSRVGIFDTSTSISQFATTDENPYEYDPSWSAEGNRVVFTRKINGIYSMWIKDFRSGVLNDLHLECDIFYLSPDGSRLAYLNNESLSFLDLATGIIMPVSGTTDGESISWSPDSKNIAYISLQDGKYDIAAFDLKSGTINRLTDTGNYKNYPVWSPDGSRVAFSQENADYSYSVITVDLQGTTKLLADNIDNITQIEWVEPGSLVYLNYDELNVVSLQSQYRFSDVSLESGENRMYVTSTDAAGNVSPQSDDITVVYDTSNLPDVAISAEDILIYPPNPKPETKVLVKSVVKNPSKVDLENVEVELHLWDSSGELKLLKSEVLAHLAAGTEATIETSFVVGTILGSNTIIAIADLKDQVKELSESNNSATAEFYVTDKEEILISTVVAQSQYKNGQDVAVGLDIRNTGPATEGKLVVKVEDGAGNPVAVLDSRDLVLVYGAKETLEYIWNTGGTFAGAYKIHSVFQGTTGVIAENKTPFTIIPDVAMNVRIVTDKSAYGPRENVVLTSHLKNISTNCIIQKLAVKTMVLDSLNQEMYVDNREVLNLLPGADLSLPVTWNTGITTSGNCRALVQVFLDGSLFSSGETDFAIAADSAISGTLAVEPAAVAIGDTFKAIFTISNNGNADATGVLKSSLTDLESQEIMESYEQAFVLAKNISQTGEFTYLTGPLALKTYLVTLQQKTGEEFETIASTSVTIKDVTPPSVTILTPEQGSTQHGTIRLQALINDDASGVEKAECRIDEGAWKLLIAVDVSRGKYLFAWEPTLGDVGQHTISCRANDKKGNVSIPVSTTFTIQLDTTPPVLTLSTLSDGARTNQETLNISGTVHDDTGMKDLNINGEYVSVSPDGSFTHALLLVEGENKITTAAYDLAGNQSEDIRVIVLDLNAPNLIVSNPSDNLKTGEQLVSVSGTVDENCTVDVKLNSSSVFSGMTDNDFTTTVSLVPGLNHIEVTASDLAGNTSSMKRTVFYDSQKPTVVITEPGQDISTNQNSITIRGNVGDDTEIQSVTLTFDGTAYTLPVVNGVFEQAVNFMEEKLYEVVAMATDGILGHEVTTQRNVIYDITKPVLTIDPVISPIDGTSQVVSGTREERVLVTVTCPTATVGEMIYPTPTTWNVSMTNLTAGENVITASTSDLAGNQTEASASIFVQMNADDDLILIPFPSILWPPNHKKYPVLIAGWIKYPCKSDIISVDISVTDEYGIFNYTNLHFGSVVMLEAWRKGNDKDGRIYTITAVATHKDGRKTTTVGRVIVPHDLSQHNHGWGFCTP